MTFAFSTPLSMMLVALANLSAPFLHALHGTKHQFSLEYDDEIDIALTTVALLTYNKNLSALCLFSVFFLLT